MHLSGAGMHASRLGDEIGRVMAAGDTLRFTSRPPRRNLDDVS